jgi:energy-coupling factor transporter ATP-binding protein EcfA2
MMTSDDVVGVEWPDFLTWFRSVWQQGQHVAIVGPTGCGKTTVAVGITSLRKWVIALDPKGGDKTLKKSGYTPVADWPLPKPIRNDIADGKSARLVMGFKPRTMPEIDKLKALLRDTMEGIWIDGGWTVQADEAQILADRKMMNLGSHMEKMLVAARDKNISMVSLFQAPAWVPTATTRQATFIFIFPTRDVDVIKSLAAKIGRNWRDLEQILHAIPDHYCIVSGLNPREPLILTKPDEV